jgi:hypothetical protein
MSPEERSKRTSNGRRESIRKRTKITQKCSHCGAEFAYNGSFWWRKTCSEQCEIKAKSLGSAAMHKRTKGARASAWSGKGNPCFGKPPRHGKVTSIALGKVEYKFRSRWEAAYAIFLFNSGVAIEYETRTFGLSDGSSYTPDFVVSGRCIEIKGFRRQVFIKKEEMFRKEYPDVVLDVVYGNELSSIIGFNVLDTRQLIRFIAPYLA